MSDKSRRKLLKSIAAGSGAIVAGKSLPESWSKPVVDSVLLPVHAQTSPFEASYHYQSMTQALNSGNDSMFARVIDSTIPAANAGETAPEIIHDFCVDVFKDNTWRAAIRSTQGGDLVAIWWTKGTGTVGGPALDMNEKLCGEFKHPPVTFQVKSATPAKVEIEILEDGTPAGPTTIFAGTCPFGDPTEEDCIMLSDRAIKANFAPVDEQEILRKVASLPIEMWNYTDREQGVRHIGPMAQDFMASFSVGDSDRHIHMVDANGVNLAAIKALNTKLEEKDAQIKNLQEQLVVVMKRLDKLT